jgi:hypothetical protein
LPPEPSAAAHAPVSLQPDGHLGTGVASGAVRSPSQIEEAIRGCWSRDTCDPVDLADWSPADPARGQCAVSALVVQDLLGGELLLAEVRRADGSRQGVHYWNRLCGGDELDLTRSQFTRGEVVGAPEVVPRPPNVAQGRLAKQYQVLSGRVANWLRA